MNVVSRERLSYLGNVAILLVVLAGFLYGVAYAPPLAILIAVIAVGSWLWDAGKRRRR